jgi:plastocyanin
MKKYLFTLGIAFSSLCIHAATHTITFGGAAGFNYQPSTLQAQVGDLIVFQGNFGSHPLSSVSVPAGASSFAQNSGTADFSYTLTIEGEYSYQCDFHAASGMVGSFSVVNPLKISSQPVTEINSEVYPNPATDAISFSVNTSLEGSIAHIYSLSGQLIKSENLAINTTQRIAVNDLEAGIYLVRITNSNGTTFSKRFVKN